MDCVRGLFLLRASLRAGSLARFRFRASSRNLRADRAGYQANGEWDSDFPGPVLFAGSTATREHSGGGDAETPTGNLFAGCVPLMEWARLWEQNIGCPPGQSIGCPPGQGRSQIAGGVSNGLCEHLRVREHCVFFCEHEQWLNLSCEQRAL